MCQQSRPLRSEGNEYAAPVSRRMASFDETAVDEAINHLNCSVRPQQHLIGEVSDHDRAGGVGLDDQQGLILLRGYARGAGHGLAERQEPSQGQPERGEAVVNFRINRRHFTRVDVSVSRLRSHFPRTWECPVWGRAPSDVDGPDLLPQLRSDNQISLHQSQKLCHDVIYLSTLTSGNGTLVSVMKGRTILSDIEVLVEIRRKLDEARGLAVCIDVFNIFCMIDLALLETNDMLYRYDSAKDDGRSAGINDRDAGGRSRETGPAATTPVA
jgi:hypothetical protein